MLPLVVSAPSEHAPTHLRFDRPSLELLTPEWEIEHLAYAARCFDRFVFVKESARILDPEAFFAKVDGSGPAWLMGRPSCYMAVYDSARLRKVLPPARGFDKEASIVWESRLHQLLPMPTIWPEISDRNALRIEQVDGRDELVIGNAVLEKWKGTARCKLCKGMRGPGLCPHKYEQAA